MSVLDKYECEGQMSMFDLYGRDFSFGKTYPVPLVRPENQIEEQTLGAFSKKFAELRIKMPQYLCLTGGHGVQADVSWDQESSEYIAWLGEYTMHSFGERPKEENASRLSEILEAYPHQKYCLSAKACQGILRRAESRGKELPPILKEALIRQSLSKNEQDVQGGGKGILIQNERTGALSTLNNQSVCVLNDQGGQQMAVSEDVTATLRAQEHGHQPVVFCNSSENDIAGTLDANYYKGCGERQGTEREVVCYGISGYNSNAMKSSNPHSGIYEADTSRTLDLNGGSPACNQGGMMVLDGFNLKENEKLSPTLTCQRVDTKNVPIVIEGNGQRESHKGDGYKESDTMYTLNTVEQRAVCVSQDAYDKFTENDKSASLKASGGTYGGGSEALVIQ